MSSSHSKAQKDEEFSNAVGQLVVMAVVFYLFAVALLFLMKVLIFSVITVASILGGALVVAFIVGCIKKLGIIWANLSSRNRRKQYLRLLQGDEENHYVQ